MSHPAHRELAYRNQNGLKVRLLWDSRSNEVSVEVIDQLDQQRLPAPDCRPLGPGRVPPPLCVCAVARRPPRPTPADDFGGMTGMATLASSARPRRGNWGRVVGLQPVLFPLARSRLLPGHSHFVFRPGLRPSHG